MSIHVTCPTCGTDQQVATTTGSGADYCSIVCYRTGHNQPQLPSCHDAVTTTCHIGHSGTCPDRDHPISANELLNQDAAP